VLVDAWSSLEREVVLTIETLVASASESSKFTVFVAGNGLGGSLAVLAAERLRSKISLPLALYTFGAPLTYNVEFAEHFVKVLPREYYLRRGARPTPTATMRSS